MAGDESTEQETGQQPATGGGTGQEDPTFKAPPQEPKGSQGRDEALGDGGKAALERERQARREAERKLKEMRPLADKARELEEEQKSEAEKQAEKLTAAEKRAAEAEARLMRAEVAAEKGLTARQARRLQGSSREELEADADDLLSEFGAREEQAPKQRTPVEKLKPGATPSSGAGPADMNDWMRRKSPTTN